MSTYKEPQKKYYETNKPEINRKKRLFDSSYNTKIRLAVLDVLGLKCCKCGFLD